MGFKYDDKAIKCPFYKNVVCTTNGKFIGIVCAYFGEINLGFEADTCIRFKSLQDVKDYTKLYCKSCYEQCRFYKLNEMKRN